MAEEEVPANQRYYIETGSGHWVGAFTFDLTDWDAFLADRIGIVNRILVLALVAVTSIFGDARITSVLAGDREAEPGGIATNVVRITKWGITLYFLRERYLLHPDGRCVTVDSIERFGPIPFLFRTNKAHPAEVIEEGSRAIYYMPLLGADWVGRYQVLADGSRIEATLTTDWAEASERIEHVE